MEAQAIWLCETAIPAEILETDVDIACASKLSQKAKCSGITETKIRYLQIRMSVAEKDHALPKADCLWIPKANTLTQNWKRWNFFTVQLWAVAFPRPPYNLCSSWLPHSISLCSSAFFEVMSENTPSAVPLGRMKAVQDERQSSSLWRRGEVQNSDKQISEKMIPRQMEYQGNRTELNEKYAIS